MNYAFEAWTYRTFELSLCRNMKFSLCIKVTMLLSLLMTSLRAKDAAITKVSHPTDEWIQRADLYFRKTSPESQGWLLLCPGRNGNGEGLLNDKGWLEFAKEHQLLMCGISFASSRKDDLLGRYTEVQKGSGELILKTMDHFAGKELPMLVVGFSAGARFTTNWIAWKPERVIAWSAQAVGNWPDPVGGKEGPPGIVASGEYDVGSWFAALQYFQAARKQNKEVIWLSLEKLGHKRSPQLDDFTRHFFVWSLARQPPIGLWYDIDSKKRITEQQSHVAPTFSCCLPTEKLALFWENLHHP